MLSSSDQQSLSAELEALLAVSGSANSGLQRALEFVLDHFACTSGTIHSLNPQSQMLQLRAKTNIPDGLLPRIEQIPVGKGMAGLAVERCEPVQVCNLQTDKSGVAKPGAKQTGMKGSIALPILADNQVIGVLGVAKPSEYEYSIEEIAMLTNLGEVIGRFMSR